MTNNLRLTKQYTLNNDVELDLNGHTLNSTISAPLLMVKGKVSVKGGNVSTKGQFAQVKDGGEITIENGTYTTSAADVIRLGTNGTAIVNGGELTGREGAIACRDGGSTIIVNGGTLVGTDNYAIATNGSNGMGGNRITINDGTFEGNIQSAGYEAIGIYVANNDVFVMNGGSVVANGGTGICMRAGDVTINGGSITATNVDKNGNVVADGKIGDDSTVMTGCSAVIFHETSNYPGQTQGEMKLTVNGGTITGVDHSIQVLSNAEEPKVYVTGGTLTPVYPEPAGN